MNSSNENIFVDMKHAELANEFRKSGMDIPEIDKVTESNFISKQSFGKTRTDGARSLVDNIAKEDIAADTHAKYRESLSKTLPKFLQKFFLACGTVRSPWLWIIGFPFRFVRSYVYYMYLKIRVLLGSPKDDIHLGNILYINNPIQSAIFALNPGGQVFFPAGTYLISSNITMLDDVKLIGVGSPSIIKMADASNHARMIFIAQNQSNIEIKHLTLDSNGVNQGSGFNMLIRIEGASSNTSKHIKIKDCILKNVEVNGSGSNFGISFSGGTGADIHYVEISGCRATDWEGNTIIHAIGVKRFLIHDNILRGPEDAAASSSPVVIAQYCQWVIYHNNIVTHFDAGGALFAALDQGSVLANSPSHIVVSDNIGFDNFGDQILIEDARFVCVTGNVLTGLGGATESGITCSATLSIISNNICEGHGNPGIALFNHSSEATTFYMICSGNVCANNGDDAGIADNGIWLDDVKRCIIANNMCIDTQGTPTQEYGIRASGTSDENLLIGNITFGNVSGGILLVGSNNVELGNVEFDGSGVDVVRFVVGGTAGRLQLGNFKQLGDIDPDTFGGHQNTLYFHFENVLANTTNVMLPWGSPVGHTLIPLEKAGSVLGIFFRTTAVLSAGTAEVNVLVEVADTGFGISLTTSNGTQTLASQAKDTDTFTAGQRIAVEIVTDASFAPTTMDVIVGVRVEY